MCRLREPRTSEGTSWSLRSSEFNGEAEELAHKRVAGLPDTRARTFLAFWTRQQHGEKLPFQCPPPPPPVFEADVIDEGGYFLPILCIPLPLEVRKCPLVKPRQAHLRAGFRATLGCLVEGLQTRWAQVATRTRGAAAAGGVFPRPCIDLLCLAVSFYPSLICSTESNVFLTS